LGMGFGIGGNPPEAFRIDPPDAVRGVCAGRASSEARWKPGREVVLELSEPEAAGGGCIMSYGVGMRAGVGERMRDDPRASDDDDLMDGEDDLHRENRNG
jgi:hypothetical protein